MVLPRFISVSTLFIKIKKLNKLLKRSCPSDFFLKCVEKILGSSLVSYMNYFIVNIIYSRKLFGCNTDCYHDIGRGN